MKLRKLIRRNRSFVADQGGMESLQAVALVAIGALMLVGATKVGTVIKGKMDTGADTWTRELGQLGGDNSSSQ